jgi:hypothetical protein
MLESCGETLNEFNGLTGEKPPYRLGLIVGYMYDWF